MCEILTAIVDWLVSIGIPGYPILSGLANAVISLLWEAAGCV
jgi:hypothetical protein